MTDSAPHSRREAPWTPRLDAPVARVLSWSFVAAAAALVAVTVVVGALPAAVWTWSIVVIGVAGVVAAWSNRLPIVFAVVFVLAATRLGTWHVLDELHGGGAWRAAVDLAIGVALSLVILVGFQYRNGRLSARDWVDVVAILVGTGVAGWVTVARPLADMDGVSRAHATMLAAYLPIAALLAVLVVDIAFAGVSGNRTMRLASAAALVHLAATWIWQLGAAEHLSTRAVDLGVTGTAAALCLLAAALAHPDVADTMQPIDPLRASSDSIVRVVILGIATVVPVALVAATAPSSTVDRVVRAVGISLLVVAIVTRLLIATRQNREARETLLQQVTSDDLTRLPNRSRFLDEVAEVLEQTWHAPVRATVVQLSLDRFKNINDNFGHYAANEVLIVVAERLRTVSDSIGGLVARVGGDDFAMVHGGTTCTEDAMAHAEAIRSVLATPIELGDASVFVTASIGVALAPRNRTTAAEDLVRFADIAAHEAKQNGRNRVEVFDESMQARLTRRMDVEHALHGAIGRQEMRLYHQPIVDIVTGRVSGFEALMRWVRQDGTTVSPADFIPIAEETGIICDLGAWALRDALSELRRWIDDGIVPPSTTMSVNVSPRQIADVHFPAVVRTVLTETGVPAHLLWLEITESMMLDEPELAAPILDEVRAMGVRIAMDDFGTGFSSLSVLQQFPIQRIKIDRAFVNGLGESIHDRSLVRTIIAMARSMALDLVAEGVETVQQLQALRELGCDKAQGFLISRPVPADAMRSTMVAIDEMASLSLFAAAEIEVAEPVERPPVRASALRHHLASAGPIAPMASRPLRGPML